MQSYASRTTGTVTPVSYLECMLLADSFIERNGSLLQIVASVVLALAAGVFGWWRGYKDRRSKTFDYCLLSDVPILSHRPDDAFLKVTYMDEEVDNPRIVRVRFANTGTDVIRAPEVLDAYVLTVNARIVTMMISEQSSRSLASFELAVPDYPACEVHLTLSTLNSGDNFTLQMIVDSESPPEITVAGRIEGQSRHSKRELPEAEIASRTRNFWTLGVLGVGLALAVGLDLWMSPNDGIFTRAVAALAATGAIVIVAQSWMLAIRERRTLLRWRL